MFNVYVRAEPARALGIAETTVRKYLDLLADLHVKHASDYDAARAALQRIIDLAPGLAAAASARQRMDRLRLELKGKEKSQAVKLGSYEKDLGLKKRREN